MDSSRFDVSVPVSGLLSRLCGVHDRLTQAAAVLAAIGLILIVSFYVYEVVSRYFFNAPTAWVSDFVSYILAASVFLALPKVTRDKSHVAVTIVVDSLPRPAANIMHLAVSFVGFVSLLFAGIVSLQENLRQYHKGIETLAIIPIPQWWVSAFITFGLLLSAFYFLRYMSADHRPGENAVGGLNK